MFTKTQVLGAIKKFNNANESVKANFMSLKSNEITISFSGPYCVRTKNIEGFPVFSKFLEECVEQPIEVKKTLRVADDDVHITYMISEESPANEIINILNRYAEGTPLRKDDFED